MPSAIEITGLRVSLGNQEILRGITAVMPPGSVTALIGPSGSGKSTLLRCLVGFVPLQDGQIAIAGARLEADQAADLRRLRERVGTVSQQYTLWPHRTVLQNLCDGPILVRGLNQASAEQRAYGLLMELNLVEKADAYPTALSGGQQQRIAIARALAMDPEVILLDEVTSALDPERTADILVAIRKLVADGQRTVVMATHEIGFARQVADQVVFLDKGAVVEQGSPAAVLDRPSHPRTKRFLSAMSLAA